MTHFSSSSRSDPVLCVLEHCFSLASVVDADQRAARSRRSSVRRSSRSLLITRWERLWWPFSRVSVTVLAIGLSGLSIYSESLVRSALLTTTEATPQRTLERLVRAAELWPMDRNIRWSPQRWISTMNRVSKEHRP